MRIDRRAVLAAAPALLPWPGLAHAALSPLIAYERQSGGRVGLYARNIDTGAAIAWRANERFVMCSTFKASLAACVLARVDRGWECLGEPIAYGPADLAEYAPVARANLAKGALSVEAMCQAAVELSDNTCANLLLARIGGPSALTAFWRSIGDGVSRLDHNEPMLNRSPPGDPRDTTTPAAMADTFRRFVFGEVLSDASRARLTGWLIGCRTGDNRLRAGLPKSWTIGDKTGNNGKDAAGDIAVVLRRP
ncbi:MAG: class A beta-lactamase, partial [Pseudomonadota bacterium]|nr:class A beta-lactamase [Pseudomonadota bacterium]